MAENAFKADWPSFALGFNTGKSKGGSGGGGAELNIHYGMEPPEDTTKLWVKTSKPSRVRVGPRVNLSNHECTSTLLPATLPVSISGARCCSVGNMVYVIGGKFGTTTADIQKTVYRYDIETGELIQYMELPKALYDTSCIAIGSKIYIFGGRDFASDRTFNSASYMHKTNYCINTETKTISTIVSMPVACLQKAGIAAIGSNIYLFGGTYAKWTDKNSVPGNASVSTIYRYNGSTITEVATLPSVAASAASFVVGDYIYVMYTSQINGLIRFNPADDTYEKVGTNGNLVASTIVPVLVDNYVYGFRSDYIYRWKLDTWEYEIVKCPAICKADCADGTLHDGKIYILGGKSNQSDAIYEFSISNIPNEDIEGTLAIRTSVSDYARIFDLVKDTQTDIQVALGATYKCDAEGTYRKVDMSVYENGAWVAV